MASFKRLLSLSLVFGLMNMIIIIFSACTSAPSASDAETDPNTTDLSHTLIPGATGPIISFATLEHDFGSVAAGEESTKSLVFVNRGSETLVIEKVRAG